MKRRVSTDIVVGRIRGSGRSQQLDPVELAILLIGYYELESSVPMFRVQGAVINEAVNLARRFGAEDGHKYVNAVLDRASRCVAGPAGLTPEGQRVTQWTNSNSSERYFTSADDKMPRYAWRSVTTLPS